MRKWNRERGKRRKKDGEGHAKEKVNAPTPLQPKYFDNEPAAQPVPAPAEAQHQLEPEPAFEPAAQLSETQPSRRPSRRRRGRGGRGRGARPQPAESAAAATPEAPAPAPEIVSAPATEIVSEPAPEIVGAPPPPLAEPVPVTLEPAPAVAESTPAPARASKGTVVLAIGLPGSGKSSWFKRHAILPLSSDLLRQLLFDDAEEQRFQDLVFSNLRSMLKARLIARRPLNYVDATNLTPHDRQSWIKLAKDYGYDVQGLFFDVSLELCLERNHRRSRTVSDDVMRRMAAKLKPPTFDEGFSKITVVRVKPKESEPQPGPLPT
jgi:predicted kinase